MVNHKTNLLSLANPQLDNNCQIQMVPKFSNFTDLNKAPKAKRRVEWSRKWAIRGSRRMLCSLVQVQRPSGHALWGCVQTIIVHRKYKRAWMGWDVAHSQLDERSVHGSPHRKMFLIEFRTYVQVLNNSSRGMFTSRIRVAESGPAASIFYFVVQKNV
jgi:hypothetical protein